MDSPTAGADLSADHQSFTQAADPNIARQELPPGVWREVIAHLPAQEQFVASMVCRSWRSHALDLLQHSADLEVCLNSGAAAAGFARWLSAHGHKLQHLTITEHFFSHRGRTTPAAAVAAGGGGGIRSRLGAIARVALWQGLHAGGKPLQHLHTLKVYLDDISVADAVAIGLCVMPALTHLTLESNASAIGVTGAAGLVTLTSLRELILPTQALGDQGLQFFGASLANLQSLSVHNDGHVTDDGMSALGGMTSLTALDLQGNVSITQSAMPVLASAALHLRRLNLSWIAMVNDWGLGQLSSLHNMQHLNLTATGVNLESPLAASALRAFTALSHLDITRCRVWSVGIAQLAKVSSLCELILAENTGMASFEELRPLQKLSALTKLDLSSPSAPLRQPGRGLSAVAELTQLKHLALNNVLYSIRLSTWLIRPLLVPGRAVSRKPPAHVLAQLEKPPDDASVIMQRDLLTAAEPVAATLWRQQQPQQQQGPAAQPSSQPTSPAPAPAPAPQAVAPKAAAAAGGSGSDVEEPSPWAEVILTLPSLSQLTRLEFANNLGSSTDSAAQQHERAFAAPRLLEPALVLMAFAAAEHTALRAVSFTTPARVAALVAAASGSDEQEQLQWQQKQLELLSRGKWDGMLRGQWVNAVQGIAAAMLAALGFWQGREIAGFAEQLQHKRRLLQTVGAQQQQQDVGRDGGVISSSSRQLTAHQQRISALLDRLQTAVDRMQAGREQQQQQDAADEQQEESGRPSVPSVMLGGGEWLLLSRPDAVEVLSVLLPNLGFLQFDW